MKKNLILLFAFFAFFLVACKIDKKSSDVLSPEEIAFRNKALETANDATQLVLSEKSIASLSLESAGEEIGINLLNQAFERFNIEFEAYESYTEIGKINNFSGWKGGVQILTINPKSDTNNQIGKVVLQMQGVVDEYGVNLGMNYRELSILRPDVKIYTDSIMNQPVAKVANSSISYLFCCSTNPKQNYTVEDLTNMKIQSLQWTNKEN